MDPVTSVLVRKRGPPRLVLEWDPNPFDPLVAMATPDQKLVERSETSPPLILPAYKVSKQRVLYKCEVGLNAAGDNTKLIKSTSWAIRNGKLQGPVHTERVIHSLDSTDEIHTHVPVKTIQKPPPSVSTKRFVMGPVHTPVTPRIHIHKRPAPEPEQEPDSDDDDEEPQELSRKEYQSFLDKRHKKESAAAKRQVKVPAKLNAYVVPESAILAPFLPAEKSSVSSS